MRKSTYVFVTAAAVAGALALGGVARAGDVEIVNPSTGQAAPAPAPAVVPVAAAAGSRTGAGRGAAANAEGRPRRRSGAAQRDDHHHRQRADGGHRRPAGRRRHLLSGRQSGARGADRDLGGGRRPGGDRRGDRSGGGGREPRQHRRQPALVAGSGAHLPAGALPHAASSRRGSGPGQWSGRNVGP